MNAYSAADPTAHVHEPHRTAADPVERAFAVTFFRDYGASTKHEEAFTLASLGSRVRTVTASSKERLPWLKLARFGETRSDKNSLRHDGNVLAISGVEADYDGGKITVAEAVETATKAGLLCLIYTSPSHTEAAPRWRVLCPLSAELAPERRDGMMGRLNGLFRGVFSSESWTLSQSYYFGSVNGNPAHRVELIEGEPIDELDELDAIWCGKPNTGEARTDRDGKPRTGPVDEAALLAEITSGASYHEAGVRLLGKWARDGVPYMDARARLVAAFDGVFPPDRDERWEKRRADVDRCLQNIYGKEARAKDQGKRSGKGKSAPPGEARPARDLILSPGAPLDSARQFIRRCHVANGLRTLHHQNGTFYTWAGSHYVETSPEEMRAALYRFLDRAKRVSNDGEIVPFDPTKNKVANAVEATAAETQLGRSVRPPAWLNDAGGLNPTEIIACANGLLHLPTLTLQAHTPSFFTLNALSFGYQANPPEPRAWLEFLASLWPDDPDAIALLQEMFGLCLTGDTSHQKAFLIVGPKRSGKGTIARVLTELLGAANVCGPTLSSLGQNFGLAPLIGKRLAIVSDARLGGKTDQHVIVERILAITGEDGLTIDRKFREGWTGKLDTRFLILTNELPKLADASGALASRFLILTMTRSFYGSEDLALTAKLTAELPGILGWAIEGWKRLTARGHFVPPASSAAAQQNLEDLGSPIGAFLRDRCIVAPGVAVRCDELYAAWRVWCGDHGRDHPGTTQTFSRDLGAAVPGMAVTRPRAADGSRIRYYEGVCLAPA